jgi:hypothetical protein
MWILRIPIRFRIPNTGIYQVLSHQHGPDEQLNNAFNFAYLPTLPVPERYLVLLELPGLPAAPGRHVVLAALLTVAPVLKLIRHKQLRPLPTHNIVCSSRTDEKNHDSLFGHLNQSMFGVCRIQIMNRMRHPECGSKDPNPAPYKNVTDPEHYFKGNSKQVQ